MLNAYGMDWNCEKDNCFNRLCRMKFHVFAPAFDGKCNFSDVDGLIEKNGQGLLLEWKNKPDNLKQSQDILFTNLTQSGPITGVVLAGDAEIMKVTHLAHYWKGKFSGWKESDINGANAFMRRWFNWAKGF